jgi:hypothetical protein
MSISHGQDLSESVTIVAGHFATIVWHLLLPVKVQPSSSRFGRQLLAAVNLFSILKDVN